jgi:hypothetical protein
MRHKIGLVSVSLLILVCANSFAVDRVTGVRIDRFLGIQAARPDNPALRISRRVIDHVDEQLADNSKAATVGIKPSREIEQVASRAGARLRHRTGVTKCIAKD